MAQTFISGIVGVPVIGSAVLISSTGQVGIQGSSARYKHDIQPMGAHSRGLLQLRPVIFRYKHDAQGERQYGLIAEEVAKVYPELVTRGATGDVEAVRYHEVIPMLLNEVQHQQRQLADAGPGAGGAESPECTLTNRSGPTTGAGRGLGGTPGAAGGGSGTRCRAGQSLTRASSPPSSSVCSATTGDPGRGWRRCE